MIIALLTAAHADCAADTPQTIPGLIQRASIAIEEDLPDEFSAAHDALAVAFVCQKDILPPSVYAEHLMNLSLVAYFENRGSWELPLASALIADPGVRRPDSRVSPLAVWQLPEQDNHDALPVPDGYIVYLDGRQVILLPRKAETHFIQVEHADTLTSAFLDARSPASWVESLTPTDQPVTQPIAQPARPTAGRLLPIGGALVGVGAAGIAASMLAHGSHGGEPYPGQGALRALNLTSWGVAVGGGALLGLQLRASPGSR